MTRTPCLDDAELSELASGLLDGARADLAERHVARCGQCQSRLALHRLTPDSLIAAAQQARARDPIENEPELASALAAIGRFRSNESPRHNQRGGASLEPTQTAAPEIHNYRLLEKLGEGGMGTVYRAMHVRLEKTVALKIMKADRSGHPQAVSRFEREMKAIGRLEHPHIIRALDAGEEQGVYFLAMEYVAGVDLEQLIRSQGPLSIAEACEIVRQAALGLAHAHEHNLIHRDVKPSNLMLSPEGQVKVLDLGLAQFQQSAGSQDLTIEGQMIGTLLYMSPEQRAGSKYVDHRSDIFSLGVTLYCLLAGGLPLERGQPAALLPPIEGVRGDVPPALAALSSQVLAARPDDRLATMAELAERLRSLAAGQTLAALVRRARGRPLDLSVLPPAILPSRTPPVQSPANPREAEVSTQRAHADPTRVTPASGLRSTARSVATSPLAGWVAAGLASIALAAVIVIINRPEPQDPPIVPGTLVLTSAGDDDKRLAELLARQPIRLIDPAGRSAELTVGRNLLLPGTYRLAADEGELTMPVSQLTIEAGRTQRLALVLPAAPAPQPPRQDSWDYATIPDGSGPYVRYVGSLWYEGMPTREPTTFRVTLKAKDEQLVGQLPCRWIEIESVTQAASGDYTERGLLLIDAARYQSDRFLDVKEGWISAESESLRQRLAKQFGDSRIERLVVKHDRGDPLATRAQELNVYIPNERLSIQHVLVLLLGGSVPTSPEPLRKSRVLVASEGQWVQERALLRGAWCDVLRSGEIDELDKPGAKGYLIATNANLAFGLERLRIGHESLDLVCRREHSSNELADSPPDSGPLAAEAERIAGLKQQKLDPIGIALLPATEGALASYSGEIGRGPMPKVGFKAWIRSAGTSEVEGRVLQALEIRAETESLENGARHVEEAWLRFDRSQYAQEQFAIYDGWFTAHGETFPFDPLGQMLPTEDELLVLGQRLPANRLAVHDVLGLLFDAKLEASSTGALRGAVERVRVNTGQEPIQSETQWALRGKPSVTADLWTFPKQEGWPMDYVICRSPSIPFDFCSVDLRLALPSATFTIKTDLVSYETSGAPPRLSDLPAQSSAALATAQKVKAKLSDPNVRVWRTNAGALFAEFAGTSPLSTVGRERTVVFLAPDGTTARSDVKTVFLDELRPADKDWVKAGRFWDDGKRLPYDTSFTIERKTTVRRVGQKEPLESFSKPDQAWITRQESLRREVQK